MNQADAHDRPSPGSSEDVEWVALDDASAAGTARRSAEQLARRLGFGEDRAAEIGLAVTELAANVHKHAGGGALLLRARRTGRSGAVEVVALDAGPGMADVNAARRDGFSTAGTLGIGIGAIERLADQVELSSQSGRGTVVVARFDAERDTASPPDGLEAEGLTRALAGESMCGDAYSCRRDGAILTLMLCDGSGHGPLAASASRDAVQAFHDGPAADAPSVLRRMHQAMVGTRGGAVAVARLDPHLGNVQFAGIGNVGAAVLASGPDSGAVDKRGMVSIGGVAGFRSPVVRAFDYPLPPGAVVVMHSDGVRARWRGEHLAGVLHRSPLLIASTLLRDAGVRNDDACVLVGRVAR